MERGMKVSTWLKLAAVGLLVLAVFAVMKLWGHYTSEPVLRRLVGSGIRSATDAEVRIGSISLGLDGKLRAGDVAVTPAGRETPLIAAAQVELALDRTALATLKAVPESMVIADPRVALVYREDEGVWNFQSLQLKKAEGTAPPGEVLLGGCIIRNATISIDRPDLFADGKARSYDGLNVELRPAYGSSTTWELEGDIRGGALSGTALDGWLAFSEGLALNLSARAPDLLADEALFAAIPSVGQVIWDMLQPTGPLACEAHVSSRPGADRVDYSIHVQLKGNRLMTQFFPVPFSSAVGGVDVRPGLVRFDNVAALVDPSEWEGESAGDVPVETIASGTFNLQTGGMLLRVQASDLPLCQRVFEAIPGAGEQIWQKLKPDGKADVALTVSKPSHGEQTSFRAVVSLNGASFRIAGLPFPLVEVVGTVEADDQRVELHDLKGAVAVGGAGMEAALPPSFALSGIWDTHTGAYRLSVQCDGLPMTRDLVTSIPQVGERLWEELRPEGEADLSLALDRPPGGGEPRIRAAVEFRDAAFSLRDVPLPLVGVTGKAEVDGGLVRLREVEGLLRQDEGGGPSARFKLNGVYDSGGRQTRLVVGLGDLVVDQDLLEDMGALSEGAEHPVRPHVRVSGTVTLWDNPDRDALDYLLDVDLRAGEIQTAFSPLVITGLGGVVRATPEKVWLRDVFGSLYDGSVKTQQGYGSGRVKLNGSYSLERKEARIELEARNVCLTREMVRGIPRVGERIWDLIEPEGVVTITGRVLYRGRGEEPLSYLLGADLKDVSLRLSPAPVPLHSVFGQVLVTEDHAASSNITGIACGGRFLGAARVDYGDKERQGVYKANLEFRKVDLKGLMEALTGQGKDMGGELQGMVDVQGKLTDTQDIVASGSVRLSKGHLWQTPFFLRLVDVLHLSRPGKRGAFEEGEMSFSISKGVLTIHDYELVGGGMEMTGYGTVRLPGGELDMTVVLATSPRKKGGIPILSNALRTIIRGVEKQLIKIRVGGTVKEPEFQAQVLPKLTRPIESLRDLLFGRPEE